MTMEMPRSHYHGKGHTTMEKVTRPWRCPACRRLPDMLGMVPGPTATFPVLAGSADWRTTCPYIQDTTLGGSSMEHIRPLVDLHTTSPASHWQLSAYNQCTAPNPANEYFHDIFEFSVRWGNIRRTSCPSPYPMSVNNDRYSTIRMALSEYSLIILNNQKQVNTKSGSLMFKYASVNS